MDSLDIAFNQRKETARYWLNKAYDLHTAAGVVWASIKNKGTLAFVEDLGMRLGSNVTNACTPVYEMLYGMAIELALKAAIVAQGKQPQTTHVLATLAIDAGVCTTSDDAGVFSILSESIYWTGRYPVPLKVEDFKKHYHDSQRVLMQPVSLDGYCFQTYNGVLEWENLEKIWLKCIQRAHLLIDEF